MYMSGMFQIQINQILLLYIFLACNRRRILLNKPMSVRFSFYHRTHSLATAYKHSQNIDHQSSKHRLKQLNGGCRVQRYAFKQRYNFLLSILQSCLFNVFLHQSYSHSHIIMLWWHCHMSSNEMYSVLSCMRDCLNVSMSVCCKSASCKRTIDAA